MKRFRQLTLDVFDTCLVRDFISDDSLWQLLGRQIISQFPGISNPAEFARLRRRAEGQARADGSKEDITLADVYSRISADLAWSPEQRDQAVALEEELESRGLRSNPALAALLADAHGSPVTYLTDTPHRGAFIRSCLDEQSAPAGRVLSSGDLGLRKGTGSLFREASTLLSVPTGEMLHIGNDRRTDDAGSARAGVPFAFVPLANPTRYEVALDLAVQHTSGLLGPILAGSSRFFRLSQAAQSAPALVSLVSGVAGPAVVAAVAWTLLSAQRDDVDRLYFVARDGELLLAVARLLQQELGLAREVECRYLYGSRRAWHLPALSLAPDADFATELRNLLARSGKRCVRELLAQLDLDADEMMPVVARELSGVPIDVPLGGQLNDIVDALSASPEIQALALARAKAAYEATVAYLSQEEVFSSRQPGLVDVGWHGAASASLASIAATQGTSVNCYFAGGLCGLSSVAAPAGSQAYLIDARGREPEHRQALVHLMESFCAGSGGSTLGYAETAGSWHPRLAPESTNKADDWGLRDFQQLVCAYAVEACRGLAKWQYRFTLDELNAIRPVLVSNLCALWYSPDYGEAEAWGSFPFEDDNGTAVLGRAITAKDLARLARYFRDGRKRPRFGPWRQATVMRTGAGRWYADPLAPLRAVSTSSRRQTVRARMRSRLAFRPVVRFADVSVRDGVITVQPTRESRAS